MEDRVKCFGSVSGVQVAAGMLAITVKEQWHASTEQIDELGYDLCFKSAQAIKDMHWTAYFPGTRHLLAGHLTTEQPTGHT